MAFILRFWVRWILYYSMPGSNQTYIGQAVTHEE